MYSDSGRKLRKRGTLKKKRFKKEWVWCYAFIAPLMIGILVFSLFPLIYALGISLTEWDGITEPKFVGLQNFVQLFRDEGFYLEVRNTFIYTVIVVPATLGIALVLANFLNMRLPGKSFFRTVYYLPNVTMAVAIAAVWKWLFNSDYGMLNEVNKLLGLPVLKWLGDPKLIMPAICIVAVWSGVGYAAVLLLSGLQGISQSYYEAAMIDGAGGIQQFFHITIPLLTPTIFFVLVTSLMNAFKAFDLVFMFTSGKAGGAIYDASRTMMYGIYNKGFRLSDMGYAAAESFVLFAIIMLVTVIQMKGQEHWVHYE